MSSAASTENNLAILRGLCALLSPQRTLEIGLGPGASAIAFAEYHQERQHLRESHTAIDPYQSTYFQNAGIAALSARALAEQVRLIAERSEFALADLVRDRQQFDLIYVDGSHLFEDVFVDVYFCAQLVPVGGMLVLDDCSTEHIRRVVQFVRTNWAGLFAEVDLLPFRPNLSPLKYRIGKVLHRVQCRAFQRTANGMRQAASRMYRF